MINVVFRGISLAFIAFFSRRLLARSSGTRMFLVVVSGLFAVLGTLTFLDARSFSVLTSSKVRSHFA